MADQPANRNNSGSRNKSRPARKYKDDKFSGRRKSEDDSKEKRQTVRDPKIKTDTSSFKEKRKATASEYRREGKPDGTDRRENYSGKRPHSKTTRDYSGSRDKREIDKKSDFEKPSFRTSKKQEKATAKPDIIRLNRYISNSGICSRREADDLISGGYVSVNGEKITELGVKVSYKDQVKVKGKIIMPEKEVYVLLNKPKDYITTLDDPYAKKTVIQLVREACPERIYPVGRLDKNTTGVLLFTNDGQLAKKLTHPSSNIIKVYHVQLDMPLTKSHLQEIAKGITLDDGPIKVDDISFIDELDKTQAGIQLHSGRNRIVRRIFEHFGYKVKKLDRVFFAGLTKQKLPRGKWRFLTPKEISRLKMNIFE